VLHNRACLVDAEGSLDGYYDKEHLVPFGEYVPLKDTLFFLSKLVHGIGDFAPGKAEKPLKNGNLALGVLICYETIFPELAQDRVAAGANLLVNISNDAWFGRSAAPRQHLHLSLLRAVEQERWLARATNTGISAVVDPRGRIVRQSGLFTAEVVAGEVGLATRRSPFHRAAVVIGPLLAAGAAALLAAGIVRGRRR